MEFTLITILVGYLAIGIWPILSRRIRKTEDGHDENAADYHLASRGLIGWVGGMTAAASSHSAFMLTGMVGAIVYSFTFTWLLIGWFAGAFFAWSRLYPRIWQLSRETDSLTLTQIVGQGIVGDGKRAYILILSLCLMLLMGFYASGQVLAADATLNVVLGEDSFVYVLIAFLFVLMYSSAGGMLSTAYSDIAQGAVIIITLVGMLVVLVPASLSGSLVNTPNSLENLLASDFFSLTWGDGVLATVLFIAGWFVGGASEVGAPHVMARVFAIRSDEELERARLTYMIWFGILSVLVIIFSITVKIYSGVSEDVASAGSAQKFGYVLLELFPDWFIGIAVAGFLAATISTADALILAAGASVSEDVLQKPVKQNRYRQLITVGIGAITFAFYYYADSISGNKGVDLYSYITLAWALMACVYAPPVVMQLLQRKYTVHVALLSLITGGATIMVWTNYGYQNTIAYELLPGMLVSLTVAYVFSRKADAKG